MLHAVIMAGGSGTRFWPSSRAACPKQLLDLSGGQTMIQATVARLGDAVPAERTLIVTNQRLVDPICKQLPQLPPASVLGEPCKRDTAPCIGVAAAWVLRNDPDATMVVMPADHVIAAADKFQSAIQFAEQLVTDKPDRIVTFGIKPTYPAESFGYIERAEPLAGAEGQAAFSVKQFREKPQAEVAKQYVAAGSFYWNSGIFVWKARTILDQLEKHEPEMFARIQNIGEAVGSPNFDETFQREFAAIVGKSIDYAVMEHAKDVVVIEAPFDWDDVGSWQALSRLRGEDDRGNTIDAKYLGIETDGSIVRSEVDDHLIVTVGMKDCIVVHTADATLVANRHDEEKIRDVVKQLSEREWQEHL